jgi:hypothetical protein
MGDPFSDTKSNLKAWLKASVKHFRDLREAFTRETKGLIDEAREEYEKNKTKPDKEVSDQEPDNPI